jgi:hypothetical protein
LLRNDRGGLDEKERQQNWDPDDRAPVDGEEVVCARSDHPAPDRNPHNTNKSGFRG